MYNLPYYTFIVQYLYWQHIKAS